LESSNKVILKNLTHDELRDYIESIGEKKFRANQIFSWMYKNAITFDDMKNISGDLKRKLSEVADIGNIEQEACFESKIDGTKKYLFLLPDGNIIETVMMDYSDRVTVCISSQVGCRMGCDFCASTKEGLIRNLEPWEILDQILKVEKDIGKRVSNIVMMGSGEPLDNFENTKRFLKLVNEEEGLNIGYRHITLSTCGIVPKMYELADMQLPINLAISLHSPFDEKRKEIMPVAKSFKIEEIIKAAKYLISKTNRRVTFEYSLIKGVNDSKKEADEIAKLLKGMLCHVNIIPINKIEESNYEKPDKSFIYKFRDELESKGINATIRNSRGSDIGGACGQLRRKYKKNLI
jgi:23S rRNA (adenine2503-C2)-methyltransferase